MVGTVIFKDFESGSYERMRVTVYDGHSYEDIDRQGSFSSCLVSLENNKIVYDAVFGEAAPRLTMNRLLDLCQRARQYFYKNEWVTIADFCVSENEISIRSRSSKSGIFAPIDVRTLFDFKTRRIYRLCMESEESYLGLSVRCAVVNYCLKKLFDTEDDVFGISGRGVYIDASLFKGCRRSVDFLALCDDVRKLIKTKKTRKLDMNCTLPEETELAPKEMPHMNLISEWRRLKLCSHAQMCKKYLGSRLSAAEICIDILEDADIKRRAEEFTCILTELLENYEFYFDAKSHINYISIDDALSMLTDADASDKIAERAASLSANMKLRKRLPCADYYDSHGKAYNI